VILFSHKKVAIISSHGIFFQRTSFFSIPKELSHLQDLFFRAGVGVLCCKLFWVKRFVVIIYTGNTHCYLHC
jgi:hypothetical protein